MTERRRYNKTFKNGAVAEAERTSLTAAAESLDVPITTLKYWMDSPEFADVRMKTRDELALGSVAMAIIAQGEIVRRIRSGDISDQALVATYGVGIDKAQLLLGGATARTEARDITGTISDTELSAAIREAESIATGGRGPEAAEGTPEG